MRIAELAKPGIVAAVAATGVLVAWKWPTASEPPPPRLEVVHECERGPRVTPPVATDADHYLASMPARHDRVDAAFPRATILTNNGALHCALFPEIAPLAVGNFVGLATGQKDYRDPRGIIRRQPFYDGLTFHRRIDGFIIQGGDPAGDGTGGPGYAFDDEVTADLPFEPGVLAMANKGPNTNGSQFFIMDGTAPWLAGKYTIFGMCEELDVVHSIATSTEPVYIQQVTLTRY
jgi:peptidyl-prolyl cis-trans isomerase A (cyclophilin A)